MLLPSTVMFKVNPVPVPPVVATPVAFEYPVPPCCSVVLSVCPPVDSTASTDMNKSLVSPTNPGINVAPDILITSPILYPPPGCKALIPTVLYSFFKKG